LLLEYGTFIVKDVLERPLSRVHGYRLMAGNRLVLRYFLFLSIFFVLVLAAVPRGASPPAAARGLVVYASDVTGSKELAQYYVQKRGVPASNVLAVTISVQTSYYYGGEYPKFYSDLAGPIKALLAKLGPTNIDVILLVGGIPNEVRNAAGMPVS